MAKNTISACITLTLFSLLLSSCSWLDKYRESSNSINQIEEVTATDEEIVDQITPIIHQFLSDTGWTYTTVNEDTSKTIVIKFSNDNSEDSGYGRMVYLIRIFPKDNFYYISGETDFTVPDKHYKKAIIDMNDYNSHLGVTHGYIDDEGTIIYCLGRNTEGTNLTVEAINADFRQVYMTVQEETPDYIKKYSLE